MEFPVLVLKENEAPIYFLSEKGFGLVSKGGESFYKNGLIYDSSGNKFNITGVVTVRKASILTCLRYFQPMYLVEIGYVDSGKINLDQIKGVVINQINSFKKYWLQKEDIENLNDSIRKKQTFIDIFNLIK